MNQNSDLIKLKISSNVMEAGDAELVSEMFKNIRDYKVLVEKLRDDCLELERTRDQLIIHYQQCQDDYEILRNIFINLKIKQKQEVENSTVETKSSSLDQKDTDSVEHTLKFSIKFKHEKCNGNTSVTYSHDGGLIAFCINGVLHIIENSDNTPVKHSYDLSASLSSENRYYVVSFSQNSRYIAIGARNNDIVIFDVDKKVIHKELHGHSNVISSLVFETNRLISCDISGMIICWDVNSFDEKERVNKKETSSSNPGLSRIIKLGKHYALYNVNGNIDIATDIFENQKRTIQNKVNNVQDIDCSRDGVYIVPVGDNNARLYKNSISNSTKIKEKPDVCSVSFSNSSFVLFGCKNGSLSFYNYKDDVFVDTYQLDRSPLFSISHHPSKNEVVILSNDITVLEYSE